MIHQKKCHECANWTDGSLQRCAFCNAIIDPILIAEAEQIEKQRILRENAIKSESKLNRFLRKFQESDNPFNKVLFKIFQIVFNIYMAILSFFIWLIALISG